MCVTVYSNYCRFFDDSSSSDQETFFGRTLDTISEEEEDDDDEERTQRVAVVEDSDDQVDRVAAIKAGAAEQHEHSTYDGRRRSTDLSQLALNSTGIY